jgi:hypothetical protein
MTDIAGIKVEDMLKSSYLKENDVALFREV